MIKQENELTDYEKELFSCYVKDSMKKYHGFDEIEIKGYVIKANKYICVNFYSKFHEQVVQSSDRPISKYIEKMRDYKLNKLLK